MKILHICGNYSTIYRNLVKKQIDFGASTQVFRYTTRRKKVKKISEDHVDFYNSSIRLLRSPLFFRTRIKFVAKHFFEFYKEDFDFDIIHAHMWFSNGEIAYKAYESWGIPYIIAIRNTDMNSWYYWNLPWNKKKGYNILKNAAKVVFLSPSYKAELISRLPLDMRTELEKKTLIIPNGIDDFWHLNARKNQKQILKNTIRILTVGSVDTNKNQITVLKAVNLLINKGYKVQYTVVGSVLDKRIERELMKSRCVKLLSFCSQEKLKEIYGNSDIFVMPSIHESFGLVYAEAMSQGLPIIYSKGQGFDGQFPEGEVGVSVNCMNSEEIYCAVIKVLNDYESMSSKCIELSKVFSWELLAEKYISIYSNIITK